MSEKLWEGWKPQPKDLRLASLNPRDPDFWPALMEEAEDLSVAVAQNEGMTPSARGPAPNNP